MRKELAGVEGDDGGGKPETNIELIFLKIAIQSQLSIWKIKKFITLLHPFEKQMIIHTNALLYIS